MTPENDQAVADRIHATRLLPAADYTATEIRAVLRDWARRNPPRRFALYRITEDETGCDGDVFAWGLAHERYLVVRSNDETFHGRFVSTQSMLNYLTNQHPAIGLVWIDSLEHGS